MFTASPPIIVNETCRLTRPTYLFSLGEDVRPLLLSRSNSPLSRFVLTQTASSFSRHRHCWAIRAITADNSLISNRRTADSINSRRSYDIVDRQSADLQLTLLGFPRNPSRSLPQLAEITYETTLRVLFPIVTLQGVVVSQWPRGVCSSSVICIVDRSYICGRINTTYYVGNKVTIKWSTLRIV